MHRSGATESLKGAVQGDRDPTDALVAKYNQATPGKMMENAKKITTLPMIC